jgi:phenylalanyl-tRNA synthetase beta chain
MPLKELAERLTLAGVKVEKIHQQGEEWSGVSVASVLEVNPHPNADRLRLATVDNGSGNNPTVVCGAPNLAAGQKVAYAAVGARLRDGHSDKLEYATLKASKIRGIESLGMICSEKELGISDQHEGILVLPDDAPIGTPLSEFLGDTILDFEITPNRPDLLSILGIAWEVAAQTHVKVTEPERTYPEAGTQAASQRTSVTIDDKDLCPRYLAGIVERVKIGPSPEWMQERLRAAGMRPINNVVDVTNYVMLETGQPLHAFDFRKLSGSKIVVRRARPGERMKTLDDADRELSTSMLVIADGSKAVAIAGVMGGFDAEVTPGTTTILLEAANFDAVSVRHTSTALGLRTEASIRFEKGLHPELAAVAARRAMRLLVELTGGRAAKGLVDTYPAKRSDTRVVVTRQRIQQVLGSDPATTQVRTMLTDLGFGCRWVPPDRYVVRAPYWRTDVNIADDVVEELARVGGYDRIESLPLAGAVPTPDPAPVRDLRERLKDAAVSAGLQEVITYPLSAPETLALVMPMEGVQPLRMENPLNAEQYVMRTSLRASLLQSLSANLRRERTITALFECSSAFVPNEGTRLPDEVQQLVAVVGGTRPGRWGEPTNDPIDFFDAKGLLEEMLERAGLDLEYRADDEFGLLRGRTAALFAKDERCGVLGQVHPQVATRFDIEGPVFVIELDVERLLSAQRGETRLRGVSRFPAVSQDLALLVDANVPADKVTRIIASSALVAKARLFDVYEGGSLAAGKRSLGYTVLFQSPDKTLTDADVATARTRIVRRLEHEVGAELRGG